METRYINMNTLENPQPHFRSWQYFYKHIITSAHNRGLDLNNNEVILKYRLIVPIQPPLEMAKPICLCCNDRTNFEVEELEFLIKLGELKAKMWDESNNLSYELDEETFYEARSGIYMLEERDLHKLSKWLESIVDKERQRIFK